MECHDCFGLAAAAGIYVEGGLLHDPTCTSPLRFEHTYPTHTHTHPTFSCCVRWGSDDDVAPRKALVLSNNRIRSITPITALTNLNTLVLSHNKIDSIDVRRLVRLALFSFQTLSFPLLVAQFRH